MGHRTITGRAPSVKKQNKQKNIDERAVNFPPRLESCLNARIVHKDAHKTATFGFLLPPGFTRFNSTLTLLFFFTRRLSKNPAVNPVSLAGFLWEPFCMLLRFMTFRLLSH